MNFVTVENVESSRNAVTHLINQGRTQIAIIAGSMTIIDMADRLEGYKLALQDAGIPYNPDLVFTGDISIESGSSAIKQLLANNIPFDAVFVSQANLAIGAVNALLDAGISLPEDVALISFDDLVEGFSPRIGVTAVHHPVGEKGEELLNALIDLIEKKTTAPVQRFLPTELIIRDTCGG